MNAKPTVQTCQSSFQTTGTESFHRTFHLSTLCWTSTEIKFHTLRELSPEGTYTYSEESQLSRMAIRPKPLANLSLANWFEGETTVYLHNSCRASQNLFILNQNRFPLAWERPKHWHSLHSHFSVRTPRPSRPSSYAEETVPLTKPSTGKGPYLSPGVATTGGGSRPSSRPASLLLRDALVNMFGEGKER